MMVKTDAIVLRIMKYRDTSLIVTLYTKQFGKLSGIMKGARGSKNKYGHMLQPMSRIQAMVYKKEGRDLQTIGQCDQVDGFRHITEDLLKMATGMKMVELVTMIAHEEEENIPLFRLLEESLGALNRAKKNPANLFYAFQISLCNILGFAPVFHQCVSCGKNKEAFSPGVVGVKFHLDRGGALCGDCVQLPGQKMNLKLNTMKLLDQLSSSLEDDTIISIDINRAEREEIETLLWAHLRHHVSGIRPLKSDKVFAKILSDS